MNTTPKPIWHTDLGDGPPEGIEKMATLKCTLDDKDVLADGGLSTMIYEFAVGHPGSALNELSERDGGEFLKGMTHVLMRAHGRFVTTAGKTEQTFASERDMKALYDDLKAKEEQYMLLLEVPENSVWTERISGMLGTLCTIWRQRGSYLPCRECLEGWYTRMLSTYEKHIHTRHAELWGSAAYRSRETKCCKVLWYKYHMIKLNLSVGLVKTEKSAALQICSGPSIRVLIQDEIDRRVSEQDDEYRW